MVATSGKEFAVIRKLLTTHAGLMSHLGTTDSRAVEKKAAEGDAQHRLVYEAMAYNVAKHICALAAAVSGKLDGVLLTGGLAQSKMFADWIVERVSFLAPVDVHPGENEMAALREGGAGLVGPGASQGLSNGPVGAIQMKSFDEVIAAAQKAGRKRLAIAGRPNEESSTPWPRLSKRSWSSP